MAEFLTGAYLWVKAAHVISVISWMAGMFYLPRLFVYHSMVETGSEQDRLFQAMEHKLIRIIMNPAMAASWIFGILLALTPGIVSSASGWFHVKFLAVIAMTVFHAMLSRWRRQLAAGNCRKSEKFFRRVNEIPTVLMIVIVIMVIVKPL